VFRRVQFEAQWVREAARTNLWLVPAAECVAAAILFGGTRMLDAAAYDGRLTLPYWAISGGADAARQILTTLAAALITVVGVVFSIILVALTLTSTQFGPRMLRNFIRDRGTQWTLGTFVATFVYAMLDLVSIGPRSHGDFVPHLSITVALGLMMLDVAILIYFIHHIATMIQLPQVIAGIAKDLARAIDTETARDTARASGQETGPDADTLGVLLARDGAPVQSPSSGYLQYVQRSSLVDLAEQCAAVISLHHRPGHFVVKGSVFATVWPATAAAPVARRLNRAHITGPYRTLTQDVAFAVDQLVEIAIRGLSSAVNDTFTALTCIDWLGESLCRIAADWDPRPVRRDAGGRIRLITAPVSYDRLVERAHEKIRQASAGMPAIMIRQLSALIKIAESTDDPARRAVLLRQGEMIHRLCLGTVAEPADRADVERRYAALVALRSAAPGAEAQRPDTMSNLT
jgi:uncharacterized membrane protein